MTAWQDVVIIASIIGIIVWVIWLRRNRDRWGFAVAPLSYFTHVIVFNIFVYTGKFDVEFLNGWSNAIRLHSIILFIGMGIVLLSWRHEWKYRF